MSVEGRDILIDVTRLVSRSWTGRQPTGIDRVCYAYLRHYRQRALAVVQHRGVVRVLGPKQSDQLFELLLGPAQGFRSRLIAFASRALAVPLAGNRLSGMTYFNVSHTDFDLEQHHDWARRWGVRTVYFIHDLIPVLHPELTRPRAVRRHDGRLRSALRHADGLIVSSQSVADDLASFAEGERLSLPSVVVAPIAGEAFPKVTQARSETEPYFLCVGTIEPRKNHRLLLKVWSEIAKRRDIRAPKLVLVGQHGPLTGDILAPLHTDPALAGHVELRSRCTDEELAELITSARALLMPTLAEGYGLPLVEALQMGTPVIASDIAIFREIGQGLPLLLDPSDADAWAAAILDHASGSGSNSQPFNAPSWAEHFIAVESWIESRRLKSAAACESSLAA